MGDIEKRTGCSRWEPPAELTRHRQWVTVAGMTIPVLALQHEYQAYLTLGRLEQAEKLKKWMDDA